MAARRAVRTLALLALFSAVMTVNILPFLRRWVTTPEGSVLLGTQFYMYDWNVYMGHFKEGADGYFLIHDKHTSEPHQGYWLRREYWLWGFVFGGLLGLPGWAVYHTARIAAGFLVMGLFLALARRVFGRSPGMLCAVFLAFFAAGFPVITLSEDGPASLDRHLRHYMEVNAANRFAVQFHFSLGSAALFGFILAFSRLAETAAPLRSGGSLRGLALCVFLGLGAGLCHPSTLAILYAMIPIYLVLRFSFLACDPPSAPGGSPGKTILREAILLAAFAGLTFPIVPFLALQTSSFPWSEIARWDRGNQPDIPLRSYLLAHGPIFFLAAWGFTAFLLMGWFRDSVRGWAVRDTAADCVRAPDPAVGGGIRSGASSTLLLLGSFAIVNLLFLFVLHRVLPQINRARFIQAPFYAPLAIFTAPVLLDSAAWFGRSTRAPRGLAVAALTLLVLLVSAPAYWAGIREELYLYPTGNPFIHLPGDVKKAFEWLDENTKPEQVVLAFEASATFIPGQTGNTSYWGDRLSTYQFDRKKVLANRFLNLKMDPQEARRWLRDNRIEYVLIDYVPPDYAEDWRRQGRYTELLAPVFQTPKAIVYKVAAPLK